MILDFSPGGNQPSVHLATPAKVNLFLEIRAKRPDGYHELETLMVPISLYDTLQFQMSPDSQLTLRCSHPDLGNPDENLVLRAARLLRDTVGITTGAQITLTKRIPLAAGLAGGSSDAAATLVGLNRLWNLGLSRPQLLPLAQQLGSDIAFFLGDGAAWCTGRGEVITPCPVAIPLELVLVCPSFGMSTPAVYRALRVPASPIDGTAIRAAVQQGDIDAIAQSLHNRLEEPAQTINPLLADWLERLRNTNATGVRMSGSGSTLFALCRDRTEATRVASAIASEAGSVGAISRVLLVRSCV
ncbi:4-(cytidine 5'-diphospho)-2-C-methyl-D-erythritol kinase [Tuwongella immobilis]|uniref:4-diphosphocytidyl-2-C-methyl-D-erythritol kinase n=1 Tax=Tuwongella immobilis TaxID=692036 RepID=A0A6C2YGP6_9BACT|nr:4-(cytidine 5'-diphospho)-2-C-methyl-D-erythritol kinase [Tuwongella immobilis]VIP00678.1 4-diphosphocytidyl-2-c-methyl-d-erythritol kinase : 4-diphosphocytidyl-2-C-methyl-D-erythritol kinase OS=Candidatus Kuenenia stuttgartiensis GN=ispE PE=3 SV=1: GHMP_kinases_N: GHMP_kinases_C [Tuwongella immobilis]VTR96774.1 4-diphosphocytidyl-2-c-methyl-d-erythritol kinase : 4-diphosphocytidyl-2-C-methyl-D-erythritol kinase OS=Candidatus Kuenenia stuttgartiensis GN=ispE PE=3 SV=1: GHMP_kinases_N: GHMP_kin